MSKKSCFREPFHKQHGKWAQTLLKSERQQISICIDQYTGSWVQKSLFYLYAKSYNSLLTQWL